MGTKRELAPAVSSLVAELKSGPLLDAFAGMSSVGHAVGTSRQIWSNDVQLFAVEVGRAAFTSSEKPPTAQLAALALETEFEAIWAKKMVRFRAGLSHEERALNAHAFEYYAAYIASTEAWLTTARVPKADIFLRNYSNAYFSLAQSIELDSLVSALRALLTRGEIGADFYRWAIVALGAAMLRLSNSPGHFAQFLKPKPDTFRRHQRLKRRSVWAEWLVSIADLHVVGTKGWRRKNRVFNDNAIDLLEGLSRQKSRPGVIYLDPPYTDDQYSRYYHLFETLLTYRPHEVSGIGRYPAGRFSTPFSHKSKVADAFDTIIRNARNCGADLVVSYPSNGLLAEVGQDPLTIMKRYYPNAERAASMSHSHSTFGASKGIVSARVTENIYVAAT